MVVAVLEEDVVSVLVPEEVAEEGIEDEVEELLLSLDFLGFLFRVWMLSFFMVSGRLMLCSL